MTPRKGFSTSLAKIAACQSCSHVLLSNFDKSSFRTEFAFTPEKDRDLFFFHRDSFLFKRGASQTGLKTKCVSCL